MPPQMGYVIISNSFIILCFKLIIKDTTLLLHTQVNLYVIKHIFEKKVLNYRIY